MSNPFKHSYRLPGFDEGDFVFKSLCAVRINVEPIRKLGFEPVHASGLTVYRRANDLGGHDYLPFVDRWYPGELPAIDPDKDRWLEGYGRGFVLFVMGEVQNRQYVQHSADGTAVSTLPPELWG